MTVAMIDCSNVVNPMISTFLGDDFNIFPLPTPPFLVELRMVYFLGVSIFIPSAGRPKGSIVGNPGCHKPIMTGNGWNPTHQNGDDLGIDYWLYHALPHQ